VGIFPDGAFVVAIRLEGVVGPKKSLNDSSQGGGDVWYPLESGHQGDGIGVLGMSAYTTLRPFGSLRTPYYPIQIDVFFLL
jgi:hypothetical protein